jgi:PleD family two-component response regulator
MEEEKAPIDDFPTEKKFNILVAEDENMARNSLGKFLTCCNFNYLAVEDGRMAVNALRDLDNEFDLILLDLGMPEMDGFEVLKCVRDDSRISKIPVIVMSANDAPNVIA